MQSMHLLQLCMLQYRDGVGNTAEENSSIFFLIQTASCRQQGHVGSKTLLQQNPPVLIWGCQLTQGDLYSDYKTVVGCIMCNVLAMQCIRIPLNALILLAG